MGGESLTDIFRDMGIKQAPSGAGNNFVSIPILKGKWVMENKGPGGGRAWQGQHWTPGKRRNQLRAKTPAGPFTLCASA